MGRIITGLIALKAAIILSIVALADPPKPSPPTDCPDNYCQIAADGIRIPLPGVQQPDNNSCGVACLMSIISYYGVGPDDYEVLKKKLGTNKNGTNFERILLFANNLELNAQMRKDMKIGDLQELLRDGKPVICSIQAWSDSASPQTRSEAYAAKNEYGHYVVALGYDSKNIYFMDPCLAGRFGYLPNDEFETRWHDDEGTPRHSDVIHHLGLVIWRDRGARANTRNARHID